MQRDEVKAQLRKKSAAYHHVFSGPNAKLVMEDLNKRFNGNMLKKDKNGKIDPNACLIAAGGREVLLYIDDMMRLHDATS